MVPSAAWKAHPRTAAPGRETCRAPRECITWHRRGRRSGPPCAAGAQDLKVATRDAGDLRRTRDIAAHLLENAIDVELLELLDESLARIRERQCGEAIEHPIQAWSGLGFVIASRRGQALSCEIAERDRTRHDVTELAHVSWPWKPLPGDEDVGRNGALVMAERL